MFINRLGLYHLETLLWIDRLGSFGAAADRLNTTQPAISARVRELENLLSVKLFIRHGRRMTLTVQGRELVRQCEELWPQIQRVLLATNNYTGATGIIRIGSGEIAAASCLPSFVNDIRGSMPGLSLEIEIDLTARLIDRLIGGDVDLVFAIGPVVMPGITTESIGQVELIWLAAPEVAQQVGLDEDVAFWSLAKSSPMHGIMRNSLEKLGRQPRSLYSCNDIHSLIDIVAGGGGAALFPINMVKERITSGSLIPAFADAPPPILLQVAMKTGEKNPIVQEIFRHAANSRTALKTEMALDSDEKRRASSTNILLASADADNHTM